MPAPTVRFADLVEMIGQLPLDERVSLVEVIRRRNDQEERKRIAASARAAKRQHARGRAVQTSPDDLMREIRG